jgi:hypothetical protein
MELTFRTLSISPQLGHERGISVAISESHYQIEVTLPVLNNGKRTTMGGITIDSADSYYTSIMPFNQLKHVWLSGSYSHIVTFYETQSKITPTFSHIP